MVHLCVMLVIRLFDTKAVTKVYQKSWKNKIKILVFIVSTPRLKQLFFITIITRQPLASLNSY